MIIDNLVGEDITNVIKEFRNVDWKIIDSFRSENPVKIEAINLVKYDQRGKEKGHYKPRENIDQYIKVRLDENTNSRLNDIQNSSQNSHIGLISRISIENNLGLKQYAHLPLIDFDFPSSFNNHSEQDMLERIKFSLHTLEIPRGVLLRSSKEGHYYFMGLDRVFTEEQFITFLGLCLTIKDHEGNTLADSRHVGHSLSPMSYLAEIEKNRSAYDNSQIFSTLRITPNGEGKRPIVIETYRREK